MDGPSGWSVGDVLTVGWEALKRDPVTLIGSVVIGILVNIAAAIPAELAAQEGTVGGGITSIVFTLVQWGVSAFIGVGWLRISVTAARGEKAELSQLFSGSDAVIPMVIVNLLTTIGIALGFLALIIPGIILSLGWAFTGYFVADAGLGPIDAISASWNAMRGHKMNVLGLFIVMGLICLAGTLACGVGLLVAIPLCGVAFAAAYIRGSGRYSSHPAQGRQSLTVAG